jgi:Tol biopolymer transport system component
MRSRHSPAKLDSLGVVASLVVACSLPLQAQVTVRASVSTNGSQGNDGIDSPLALSADGRFVAFTAWATNLVPGDTNLHGDIFVRDRELGTTERVSIDSYAAEADWDSVMPVLSADGRYVAFESFASNLVAGDTNASPDVFVRDRWLQTTERASVGANGSEGNGDSALAALSADGRFVAFMSWADNLVPGDSNATWDVFVRDRLLGTTERVSVDSSGAEANGECGSPALSADGRFVAFSSTATNLVAGDTNGTWDVFVHDRLLGTTERVSVRTSGIEGSGDSGSPSFGGLSISADGRCVAFSSDSPDLVPGDTNGSPDVFVHDRLLGTTERVSVASSGVEGDHDSYSPSISAEGRFVAWASYSTTLVPGDTNQTWDVFRHDRRSGTTVRASVDSSGGESDDGSYSTAISADGRFVAFDSLATDLVAGDTNAWSDAFVHDFEAAGFESLCDPGAAGVSACPCANPPAAPGRGCDNSASTGGARLTATGVAYLSMDSLAFVTSGELPSAASVLLQGDASIASGSVFGQGVRCAGGTLRRLSVKSAVNGSIRAPDFAAGDPTLSARSAALGDPILAGQSRWYLVCYRDPFVLGGCPAASTFNATQTGVVGWQL